MAIGAVARRNPTCSAIMVPWLKPTRASPEGGSARRASSTSRKRSRIGAALLTPIQRSSGSRKVSGNHCRPTGAWPHGSGAFGDTKAHRGISVLPGAADLDQVAAVGPIAVQEHHQPPRRAARLRLEPRAIELCRHHVLRADCVGKIAAPSRCLAVRSYGPQHAGGGAAPRPPGFGERPHVAARRSRRQSQ